MTVLENQISLRAYAKINLTLDVVGIRNDGFHEVDMIMHRIDLHDEVLLRWFAERRAEKTEKVAIHLKTSLPYVPTDDRNLAYKAVQLMEGYAPSDGVVRIDILKKIPVSAGLGGGSADAAAVIFGLNKLWRLELGCDELVDIGRKLGSDVAFSIWMLYNRACVRATGRGEILEEIPSRKQDLLLVKPKVAISTTAAYKAIDRIQIRRRPEMEKCIEIIKEGRNIFELTNYIANVFEEYVLSEFPKVEQVKNEMLKIEGEASFVQMSGSGSTIFMIPRDIDEAYSKLKKADLPKGSMIMKARIF